MRLMQKLRVRGQVRSTDARTATPCIESVEARLLLAANPGPKVHPLGKLEASLANLHAEFSAFNRIGHGQPMQFRPANSLVRASGGLVAVEAIAAGSARDLLKQLKAMGLRGGSTAGSMVGGMLPIEALDDLAAKQNVLHARPAWYMTHADLDAGAAGDGGFVTNAGATTSQADAAMQADVARSTYGVNGAGSVVGVISDSFDVGPGSYSADISTGDLPSNVSIVGESSVGGSDEGRAMAQLIHDVAPGAGLSFHTANGGQPGFANGITALRNAGADVIVDDIIYLAEPMFQDGVIAQAVDAAVGLGVPYFSAAGNQDRAAYEGAYRAGPLLGNRSIPSASGAPTFFGGVPHDFDPGAGVDTMQQFTLGANQRMVLSVQWDAPYKSAGPIGAPNDVDVYVLNAAGNQVVGGAASFNQGNDPVEVFEFINTTGSSATFNLMFANYQGGGATPNPTYVKYANFGAGNFTEFRTDSGMLYGHANAAGASAVAAAFYVDTPEFGTNPPIVENFSSRGKTPIFFNTSGARLATPVVRDKPRITAPDGTNTTFFGGGDVEGDGFPNFFGTSAAAPHAAAVAALMQDAAGFISPAAIYGALESTALDMDDPDFAGFQSGRDDATGFGLVRADLAVGAVVSGSTTSATPGTPDLLAVSDTGSSGTDNRTNLDNSVGSQALQFSVTGTVSGAVVTVYADGVAVGSATANSSTTVVTTNGGADLADGVRSITARQTETGKSQSANSGALGVTVDTAAPTADIIDVSPDPRSTSVNTIDIKFNQAIFGFDLSDLSLTRNGSAVDLTGATLSTVDDVTYTLGNLATRTGTAGDYVLSIVAPHGIADLAGNALVTAASDAWQVTADPTPTTPVTLRAPADAYVRNGTSAGTNFGSAVELIVKRSSTTGNTRETYLRFDLGSVPSVGQAKLRLFGRLSNTVNASVVTTVFNATNTTWGESTINFNNKPAAGATSRGTITVAGTTAKWYELDLTNFLKAEKAAGRNLVTLVLKNGATTDAQTLFNSDEAAANRPELVVTPDGPAPQAIVVSTSNLNVPEGSNAAFTVRLAAQPTSDVVVNVARSVLAPDDADLTTATASLTFTSDNWNVARAVTVNAAEDADTANGNTTFELSSSGLAGKTVVANELDNDAPAGPVLVRANADTYVRDGTHASTNFGNSAQLQVKQGSASFNRETYLRFDLSAVPTVGSAKLRLFGKLDNTLAASAGFTVYNTSVTTWSETGVTWNTKLTSDKLVRGAGTVTGTTGKWYEVDLTTFLKAERAAGRTAVTLVLKSSAASNSTILFDSDEGANRPELLLAP